MPIRAIADQRVGGIVIADQRRIGRPQQRHHGGHMRRGHGCPGQQFIPARVAQRACVVRHRRKRADARRSDVARVQAVVCESSAEV